MKGHPLLVTADIHSSEEALEAVITLGAQLSASRLLIAGDLCPHSQRMALLLQNAPFPYVAVKGNCDSLWDFKDLGWDFKDLGLAIPRESCHIAMDDGHHIGMAHGHSIWTPDDLPIPLTSGDIFILGHSHVPLLEKDGKGIIHLNPGSPSRPRGPQGATVGIITDEEVRIIRLKDGKMLANLGRMAKTSESEG